MEGHNSTTDLLAKAQGEQSEISGRTVIDKTGLTGRYDFTLKWAPELGTEAQSRTETQETLPQLFTALQEQLDLRVASAKAPVDLIVVDNAEMPSEN